MAKQLQAENQSPSPPPLWNADDIQRLAEQSDLLASQQSSMNELLTASIDRLNKVEGDIALLDIDKATLPVELAKHVNLGQIYTTAVTAALQAKLMMNPKLVDDRKYLSQNLDNVLSLADAVVMAVCNRFGVDHKTKVS